MKSLIVVISLFLAIALLIGWQTWSIHSLTTNILEMCDRFPASASDSTTNVAALHTLWNKHHNMLSLTVNHKLLDEIHAAIQDIALYSKYGEQAEYDRAILKLREAVKHMWEAEGFSLRSII